MGEEAVLETDRLTLNDTSMLLVRQAVQRVRRGGYTALIRRFTELDEQQRQQVAEDISASRLYHFNLKFAPLWVPRFLAMEPTLAMVNVMFAAGMAEGFLPNLSARRLQDQKQVLSAGELDALHQMQLATVEELPEVSRSDQTQHRLRHLEALRAAGMELYPLGGDKGGTSISVLGVRDALSIFSSINIPDSEFIVSGRVRALRKHSGVLFVTLVEEGETMQVVIERSLVGERLLSLASRNLDTGDIITVRGTYGASRNGTESLIASTWHMAPKSLHPIPFDSFTGPEARLRRPFHGPVGASRSDSESAPAH